MSPRPEPNLSAQRMQRLVPDDLDQDHRADLRIASENEQAEANREQAEGVETAQFRHGGYVSPAEMLQRRLDHWSSVVREARAKRELELRQTEISSEIESSEVQDGSSEDQDLAPWDDYQVDMVYDRAVLAQQGFTDKIGSWIERRLLAHRGVQHPEQVQSAVRYLESVILSYEGAYIFLNKYPTAEERAKRLEELLSQGYEPENEDWHPELTGGEDLRLIKPKKLELSRQAQTSLDRLSGEVQNLSLVIHTLRCIGVRINEYTFNPRYNEDFDDDEKLQKIKEVCKAVDGHEQELLQISRLLGPNNEWKIINLSRNEQADALLGLLGSEKFYSVLASSDKQKQFAEFIRRVSGNFSILDLPALIDAAFDPEYMEATDYLELERNYLYPSQDLSFDGIVQIDTLRRTGVLEVLMQMKRLGLACPADLNSYLYPLSRYRDEPARVESTIEKIQDLFIASARRVLEIEGVPDFLHDLRAITGRSLESENNWGELVVGLPDFNKALAVAAALHQVDPESDNFASLSTLRDVLGESTEKQADLLDQGYISFLAQLRSEGMHVDSLLVIDAFDKGWGDSLMKVYQDPVLRKLYAERFHILGSYAQKHFILKYSFPSEYQFDTTSALLKIEELPAVLGAMEQVDCVFLNQSALSSAVRDLANFATPPEIGMFQQPEFPAVVSAVRAIAERTGGFNDPIDMVYAVFKIMRDPSSLEAFLDSERVEFIAEAIEVFQRNGVTLNFNAVDLARLQPVHMDSVPGYVGHMGERSAWNHKIEVDDFIAFSENTEAVEVGFRRVQDLGLEKIDFKAKECIAVAQAEPWEELAEGAREDLTPITSRSLAQVSRYFEDPSGFSAARAELVSAGGSPMDRIVIDRALEFSSCADQLAAIKAEFESSFRGARLDYCTTSVDRVKLFAKTDPSLRKNIFQRAAAGQADAYGVLAAAGKAADLFSRRPEIVEALDQGLGERWTIPNETSWFTAIENDHQLIIERMQLYRRVDPNADFSSPYCIEVLTSERALFILQQIEARSDFEFEASQGRDLFNFAEKDHDGNLWAAFLDMHEKYGLHLYSALRCPRELSKACEFDFTPVVAAIEAAGLSVDHFGSMLTQVEDWRTAAQEPLLLRTMLSLYDAINDVTIGNIGSFRVLRGDLVAQEFIYRLHREKGTRFYLHNVETLAFLAHHQEAYDQLVNDYHFSCEAVAHGGLQLFKTFLSFREEGGTEMLDQAIADYGYEFEEYHDLNLLQKFYRSGKWETFKQLHEKYPIVFDEVLYRHRIIDMYWRLEPDMELVEVDESPSGIRERQLLFAGLMHQLIKGDRLDVLDQYGVQVEGPAGREQVSEYLKRVFEKYAISDKGKTIFVLLATTEHVDGRSMQEILENVVARFQEFEAIIDQQNNDEIPDGLRASIGMEYEIMDSTAKGYAEANGGRGLAVDIIELSGYAGIPHGADGVHEIATAPTDNPRLLLLEMQLLQELQYIDFNFQGEHYGKGARGYHLTIAGEQPVAESAQTHFLQNALIFGSWGGVVAGKEQSRGVAFAAVRSKGFDMTGVFPDQHDAAEMRGLSIDRWEPFERAVLTSHNAAIAIQALQRITALEQSSPEYQELLGNFPNTSQGLRTWLEQRDLLLPEAPEDRETMEIAHAWLDLQRAASQAIVDHNQGFVETEQYGYEDEHGIWVDPDEFGGQSNQNRFESVVRTMAPGKTLEDYAATTHLEVGDLFSAITPKVSNKLRAITNLFLKPSLELGGDRANALAMLETTKLSRDVIEHGFHDPVCSSIFDNNGETRQGYYTVQGGSEKMLIHAVQKALLRFNQRMDQILRRHEDSNVRANSSHASLSKAS